MDSVGLILRVHDIELTLNITGSTVGGCSVRVPVDQESFVLNKETVERPPFAWARISPSC